MTEYAWRSPAINDGWQNVLLNHGILTEASEPFGPMGLQCKIIASGNHLSTGSIIVTQAEWAAAEWLHASIAFRDRDPTYLELAALHRAVFGRKRFSYQAFAPEAEHVNIHEHALHLWGTVDGARLTPKVEGTI